jgi:molybdopterin-guanine dinucleotide biosynthesis protein A
MNCYILAGGKQNRDRDFASAGEITRIEKSFRNFAAVFDKVKLVIKRDQAKEGYLNYPHVCDRKDWPNAVVGVATALNDAQSEAVFIGSSDMLDFPLDLLVNLIKEYDGESFLGYYDQSSGDRARQPLFGIYKRDLFEQINLDQKRPTSVEDLLSGDVKLIPLPEGIDASCIGLN